MFKIGLESRYTQMIRDMRVILRMERSMVRVSLYPKKDRNMKVNSLIMICMGLVYIDGKMEEYIKVAGLLIRWMVMVY
jgi:hypothetical protein